MPTCSVTIEPLSAINRVKWAASGHQLAVGDDDGHVYIYDVGEVTLLIILKTALVVELPCIFSGFKMLC